VIALVSVPLTAQNTIQTSGVKAQAGAKDSNIKNDNALNSADQKIAPPAKKGGPAAKGVYCELHIDNRTPYYVRFYMNGELGAIIGPFGDYYPDITSGLAVLYGRAVFDDGSAYTFGPRDYQCSGGSATWSLTM
jgi:hypothetical protein